MSRMLYTRICVDCGTVMHDVGPSRKRCKRCANRRANAIKASQCALSRERETRREQERRTADNRKMLHDAALAAAQAGMSYGKYMLQNKKPVRVTSTDEPAKG